VGFAAEVSADAAPPGRRFGGVDYHAQDIGLEVIGRFCDYAAAKLRF
jgi:hypothetical protein